MHRDEVTERVTTYDGGLWICPCGQRTDGAGDTPFARVISGTTYQHPDDGIPTGEHMCLRCGRVADIDKDTMPIIDYRDPAAFVTLPQPPA